MLDYSGQSVTAEIKADVAAKALSILTDARFQDQTIKRLEVAGFSSDAVEREAERLNLDTAPAIERLALSSCATE